MASLRTLFLTLSVVGLTFLANGAASPILNEECEDDQQRPVNNEEFIRNANSGYRSPVPNSVTLARSEHAQKLREQYEKLKQKADSFVSSSGTIPQDLGVNLHDFNKFEAGSQLTSSSIHTSGANAGIRTPVATNFYNNDGSLLHTVEGLKASGQGVQFTATGGILPLKNYQEGQVISHNSGGYGSAYEKHSSSHSQHSSSSNSGLPAATITYTPTGWEKREQSSSLNVEESTKRRNYTDYLQPELVSHHTNTVVHPLNIAYGAQSAGNFNQASKTHANYDHSNSGYGLYQVPMTVIPVLGGNDANYLSETKSQSLSNTLVSSHDSTHGGVDVKPIKIQTASSVRPTPSGIDQMWHKLVQGQTSHSGNQAILQTSFGTTEAENEEHLQSHIHPIALTLPQNSQYVSKSESQKSSSYESSHQSSSGSSASEHASQAHGQITASSSGRTPTNTFVGNPNAPQNSGYAITGENKGFYAKSVELANLLSATIAPMEETQNQAVHENSQQHVEQSSASSIQSGSMSNQQQSGHATSFIQKERNPVIVTGGKSGGSGYQSSYEKHHSSSSQFEKAQSQNLGGQESFSGVQVINEPYRGSGSYAGAGGKIYDWSNSGSGYGQYTQHRGSLIPVSSYGTQMGGYNGGSRSSNSQSWQSSHGSQSSSGKTGGSAWCGECAENAGQIRYEYGTPVKNSYGLASQFESSASNINGQKTESKSASVTINDNGKVDTYSRHNK